MQNLFSLIDLIRSDPVVRLISTRRLRPILASQAPKVKRISIENRSIFFNIRLVSTTSIKTMASRISKIIKRWSR